MTDLGVWGKTSTNEVSIFALQVARLLRTSLYRIFLNLYEKADDRYITDF